MQELISSDVHSYWNTSVDEANKMASKDYPSLTEMAFLINPTSTEETKDDSHVHQSSILLLGFSNEVIPRSAAQLKFLGGVGLAISVAIFEFEVEENGEELVGEQIELDEKQFTPRRPLVSSTSVAMNLDLLSPNDPAKNFTLGVWGRNLSEVTLLLGPEEEILVTEGAEGEEDEEEEDETAYSNDSHAGSDNEAEEDDSREFSGSGHSDHRQVKIFFNDTVVLDPSNQNKTDEKAFGMHVNLSHGSLDELGFDLEKEKAALTSSSRTTTETVTTTVPAVSSAANSHKVPLLNLSRVPNASTHSPPPPLPQLTQNISPMNANSEDSQQQQQVIVQQPPKSGRGPMNNLLIPVLNLANSNSQVSLPHVSVYSRGPTPRGKTPRSARNTANNTMPPYSARSVGSAMSTARSVAPTWEPQSVFHFPVREIAPKHFIADDLTLQDFTDVKHIGDGSNSNIFYAKLNYEKVIIKMIKESQQQNKVAIHEFDLEHGLLCRINHQNIVKILGAGRNPRRFVVLEYLAGGALNSLLIKNQVQPGLTSILFRKPTFTYQELLLKARDIADAFDYLHRRCHTGATIIHRGKESGALIKYHLLSNLFVFLYFQI
jgi:hypothetical protein